MHSDYHDILCDGDGWGGCLYGDISLSKVLDAKLQYATVDYRNAVMHASYTQGDWDVLLYCYLLEDRDFYPVSKTIADSEGTVIYSNQGNQVWSKNMHRHDWFSWMR